MAETPDLLITDIFMPEMEGLETIQTARRLHPDMPIIAMSGASFGGGGPVVAGGMLFANSGYGVPAGRAGNVLLAFGVE